MLKCSGPLGTGGQCGEAWIEDLLGELVPFKLAWVSADRLRSGGLHAPCLRRLGSESLG